jgi:hypothetical protein
VVVPSDERCQLVEQLEKNVKDDTASASASVVYPNPTGNKVTIEFQNQEKPKRVTLKDVTGKEIIETNRTKQATFTFDLANLPEGLYMIEVQSQEGIKVHKVVKQ